MREEAGGLLLGPYEKGAPACYVDGPSDEAEYELFQEDLERLMPHIETAIARVPAFGEVGIKKVYNGAIPYTPDGTPIVGPAWGLKNFWLNEGHSLRRHRGRRRRLAARRMDRRGRADDRHAGRRSAPLRPLRDQAAISRRRTRRPTPTSSPSIIPTRSAPPRGRLKTAPCYERMQGSLGAVFGQKYGWERPNWFATR